MNKDDLHNEWTIAGLVSGLLLLTGFYLLQDAWVGMERWIWLGVAGGFSIYQLYYLRQNLGLNYNINQPQVIFSSLGLANWITVLRAMLLALLAGLALLPRPNGAAAWLPGILYLLAAVMDFVDGWVARVTHRSTRLGEALDMHWDGFGVLVASLALVRYGQAPAWYALVGLARYLFIWGLAWRERRGLPVFPMQPSHSRRWLAGVQMGFIAAVLLPIFTPPATGFAATLFMLPLMVSFLRDWLVVSGVIRTGKAQLGSRTPIRSAGWFSLGLPWIARVALVEFVIFYLLRSLEDGSAFNVAWWVMLICAALVLTGLLGRLAALVILLLTGLLLRNISPDPLFLILVALSSIVFMAGTGGLSLWKPEEWLIFHRAGEAHERS
ncbi:MAG: CDP-alcohol phosphatidyltransferase family protein [Anaerolineae bacterium]|nr:CDP-alcohol phosphatidyltransferase family protein [Anaerolineae bacterium]